MHTSRDEDTPSWEVVTQTDGETLQFEPDPIYVGGNERVERADTREGSPAEAGMVFSPVTLGSKGPPPQRLVSPAEVTTRLRRGVTTPTPPNERDWREPLPWRPGLRTALVLASIWAVLVVLLLLAF